MKKTTKYSPAVRDCAVRMVLEQQKEHSSQWAAIESIAGKIGCTAETLRMWVRHAEIDQGIRGGLTSTERENRELKHANEILRKVSAFFRPSGARPRTEIMASFIDDHRAKYGVEPICAELPIALATYYKHKVRQRDPSRQPARAKRDRVLSEEIRRVRKENFDVYGA